jgi:hypothetical protein
MITLVMLKEHWTQLEWTLTVQIWEKLNIKINNNYNRYRTQKIINMHVIMMVVPITVIFQGC